MENKFKIAVLLTIIIFTGTFIIVINSNESAIAEVINSNESAVTESPKEIPELIDDYIAFKDEYYSTCVTQAEEMIGTDKTTIPASGYSYYWSPLESTNDDRMYPIFSSDTNVYAYRGNVNGTEYVVSGLLLFYYTALGNPSELFNDVDLHVGILKELTGKDVLNEEVNIYTEGDKVRINQYFAKNNVEHKINFFTSADGTVDEVDYDLLVTYDASTELAESGIAKGKPILAMYNTWWGDSESIELFSAVFATSKPGYADLNRADNCKVGYYEEFESNHRLLSTLYNRTLNLDLNQSSDPAVNEAQMANVCPISTGRAICDYTLIFDQNGLSLSELIYEPLFKVVTDIAAYDKRGTDINTLENRQDLKTFLTIAEEFRSETVYNDMAFRKLTDYNDLYRAFFGDYIINFANPNNVLQNDFGEFSPQEDEVQKIPTKNITFSSPVTQYSEYTSTGIYLKAGQTMMLRRTDNNPANSILKINFQREDKNFPTTRIYDDKFRDENANGIDDGLYNRPVRDTSNVIILKPNKEYKVSSPKGGPIYIYLPASTTNDEITIEFENVLEGAFLDKFSKETIDRFINFVENSPINWVDIATKELQIHSRKDLMQQSFGYYDNDGEAFIADVNTYGIKAVYEYAGLLGDNLAEHSRTVNMYSSNTGITTESNNKELNRRNLQHANMDRARCGGLCSGNPYDSWGGYSPKGWGNPHELGHNLQRARLKIYDRSGEVSNNIFSLNVNREVALDDEETSYTSRVKFKDVFYILKGSQDEISVNNDLWSGTGSYDYAFERLGFYQQLIYAVDDFELYTKMYLNERAFSVYVNDPIVWTSHKDALGFSQYNETDATNISGNDYMAIIASQIANKDLIAFFEGFGIAVSAQAKAQVASEGYARSLEKGLFFNPLDTPKSVDDINNVNVPVNGIGIEYFIPFTGEYENLVALNEWFCCED